MQPRMFYTLSLALFVATTPASAQDSRADDFAGDRVTVQLEGPKQSLRGRLVSFDSATLTVEFPKDSPRGGSAVTRETIPTGRVRQIDVEKRDPIWNGALLGATFMAVCMATWCQQGLDGPSSSGDVLMAGVMGGLLGGGIDALTRQRQTIYKASRKPAGPRAQLSFSIKF